MEKLPEDFKTKWVAALRSQKHKQCTGGLTVGGGVCVIAVGGLSLGLPLNTSDQCENVYNTIRRMIGRSEMWRLIDMNDAGHSFKSLADYIEKTY